jgi:hypothetical protein
MRFRGRQAGAPPEPDGFGCLERDGRGRGRPVDPSVSTRHRRAWAKWRVAVRTKSRPPDPGPAARDPSRSTRSRPKPGKPRPRRGSRAPAGLIEGTRRPARPARRDAGRAGIAGRAGPAEPSKGSASTRPGQAGGPLRAAAGAGRGRAGHSRQAGQGETPETGTMGPQTLRAAPSVPPALSGRQAVPARPGRAAELGIPHAERKTGQRSTKDAAQGRAFAAVRTPAGGDLPPPGKCGSAGRTRSGRRERCGLERSGREGPPGFKRALQVTLGPRNLDLVGVAARKRRRERESASAKTASGSRVRAV